MIRWRAIFCLVVLTPSLAFAWGYDGHRIVTDIASHYLTPEAEKSVKFLLGDPTVADPSTWANEIKSDRKWDWAKPLHYANVTPRPGSFDLERGSPESGRVAPASHRYSDVLSDQSAGREREEGRGPQTLLGKTAR